MNSVERILATIRCGQADRPPVIPQIFAHAAVLKGLSIEAYVTSGEIAANCQLEALKRYRADAVFAALDVCVESAAVGCEVEYRQNIYPAVTRPALAPDTDFDSLQVPDPATAKRMPEVLKLASNLRQAVGDETLVVGVVQGPMTLAIQFLGMETALLLSHDDPERFERLLDFTTAVANRFGQAQLAAGAHVCLVFDPAACPELVPIQFFTDWIGPRIAKIFSEFKAAGAPANWLHIAGNALPILPFYQAIGADIGNFDYVVEPAKLITAVPKALCVDGNIKPLAFVEDTPDMIEAESYRLIDSFAGRGGFILSSGCEIPPEAKPENIEAMVKAAKRSCPQND